MIYQHGKESQLRREFRLAQEKALLKELRVKAIPMVRKEAKGGYR